MCWRYYGGVEEVASGSLIVVDASVVLKWFVEEEWSEQARSLLEAYREEEELRFSAPKLLEFEVANVLRYKQ